MVDGRAAEAQQRPFSAVSDSSKVVGYLPAGVLIWGGLGKLFDHLFGTSFLTPLGLALGFLLGMYLVLHHCFGRGVLADSTVSERPDPPRPARELVS